MSISQVSPSSLASNSPYVNPYAKTTETQPAATLQSNQDAQKPAKAAQTDTVTISQQALQKVPDSSSNKPDQTQSSNSQQQQSFSTQA